MKMTTSELKTLFNEAEIAKWVENIATQVNNDFGAAQKLHIISILNGAFMFTSDLVKQLAMPIDIHFVKLSSYGEEQISSGKIKMPYCELPNLQGENVLIVEDIVDTGYTLEFFLNWLKKTHKPNILKTAVVLDKHCKRKVDIAIDYVGSPVDDKFVVGYGMDDKNLYRNLPYIAFKS